LSTASFPFNGPTPCQNDSIDQKNGSIHVENARKPRVSRHKQDLHRQESLNLAITTPVAFLGTPFDGAYE